MKKYSGAKATSCVFALIIFSLVVNILYLGATGDRLFFKNKNQSIAEFAKNRSKKEVVDYAKRGQIYSSDGEEIAINVKKYKIILFISPTRTVGNKPAYVENVEKTASKLAPIIGLDVEELASKIQKAKDKNLYQLELGTAGKNLTANTKKKIEALNLPGVEFEESDARFYPMGDFASYLIGYAKNYEDRSMKKMIGELGLELAFDKELKGKNGYRVYQADAKGYALVDGTLRQSEPVNGSDIVLTINSELQRNLDLLMAKATEDMDAEVGTCAVMEAKTGRILAMSTCPSYNPNERNMTTFNNYFLEGTLECGSVFKPFIYAQAIEEGNYNGNATYQSGKYQVRYGNQVVATIRDHNNGEGWGTISFDEGLYRSSNVAICNLMNDDIITKDKLTQSLDSLGFFKADEMDGLPCAASINAYTQKNAKRLEYLTTGFGQGSTVTPYQLLKAYSVFANNGKTVEPYVVEKIVNPDTNKVEYQATPKHSEQIYSEKTVQKVKNLMRGVVEDTVGTGRAYKLNDVQIFGKTGTGQVVVDGAYSSSVHMHSFAALAPYDDPEIVMFMTFKCGADYSLYMPDLFKEIMTQALRIVNAYEVEVENPVDKSYCVDSYMNQSVKYVKSKLESKGFEVQVIGNGTTVVDQHPPANTLVSKGDRIFIRATGDKIKVPDMVGWSRKEVNSYASLAGIEIAIEGESGLVKKQSIAPGKTISPGDELTVSVSEKTS